MAKKTVNNNLTPLEPDRYDVSIFMQSGSVIWVENVSALEWSADGLGKTLKIAQPDAGPGDAQIMMSSLDLSRVEAVTYILREKGKKGWRKTGLTAAMIENLTP